MSMGGVCDIVSMTDSCEMGHQRSSTHPLRKQCVPAHSCHTRFPGLPCTCAPYPAALLASAASPCAAGLCNVARCASPADALHGTPVLCSSWSRLHRACVHRALVSARMKARSQRHTVHLSRGL